MKDNEFIIIMLVAGITLLILGLSYFFVGFHNVDLTVNMVTVMGKEAFEQRGDITNFGYVNYRELYTMGMIQMKWSVLMLIMGGLCMGVVLKHNGEVKT
jgi:hypothetical protein